MGNGECVDFTDLNRACPKDPFLVPKIDQLVVAICRHPRVSFLDAFQGYHQITLDHEDQEKTSFITLKGNYHYTMMPFRQKNVRAIYQRMVTRMFWDKIENKVEVYIDDMVVKSRKEKEHMANLTKTLKIFRRHKFHLNANKCAFGVGAGKLLGHIVSRRGIEVNLNQIKAIQ